MTNRKRVLIVGEQHGNELLGPRVWRYLNEHRPTLVAGVDYLCGNPRAFKANVRFTETDLNRSYYMPMDEHSSYEERRAVEILDSISKNRYDYVLDIHTTTSDVGSMFVTTRLDEAVRRIINATSIERIAYMPSALGAHSLIGQAPQAVSIEVNEQEARTTSLLDSMLDLIETLLADRHCEERQRQVYYVDRIIPNDEILSRDQKNFTPTKEGWFPVLLHEKSYTTYQGFAAAKFAIVTV